MNKSFVAKLRRGEGEGSGFFLDLTHQNEWVKALEEAKKPETRARRLAELLKALG